MTETDVCLRLGYLAQMLMDAQVLCAQGKYREADHDVVMVQSELQTVARLLWLEYRTSSVTEET